MSNFIRNLYNLLLYCVRTMYKKDQRKMNNKLSELILNKINIINCRF